MLIEFNKTHRLEKETTSSYPYKNVFSKFFVLFTCFHTSLYPPVISYTILLLVTYKLTHKSFKGAINGFQNFMSIPVQCIELL